NCYTLYLTSFSRYFVPPPATRQKNATDKPSCRDAIHRESRDYKLCVALIQRFGSLPSVFFMGIGKINLCTFAIKTENEDTKSDRTL
ncbi:hypothetical protein CEN50_21480, partial [Fischerella thermalis CCMEE 5268]